MSEDSKMAAVVIVFLLVVLGGIGYSIQATRNTSLRAIDEYNGKVESSTTKQGETGTTLPTMTSTSTTMNGEDNKATGAIITTNFGDIEVSFDAINAPKTVANFITLAGNHFYDGVRFHRVIQGFMIQTGDPNSKDTSRKDVWGMGGPGYKFDDELKGNEQYLEGTLAMANSGKNTNGSQFFIVTASPSVPLPPNYTVFGKVVKGMDVALKIEKVKTELKGQADRPIEDVIISAIVLKK